MSNKFYELDVVHLRLSYICPEGYAVESISGSLMNLKPFNRSEILMTYSVKVIRTNLEPLPSEDFTAIYPFCYIYANDLTELEKNVRLYFNKLRIQQPPVNNSQE